MAVTTKALALAQKYPVPTLAVALILFFVTLFAGAAAITGIRYKLEDRKVEKLEKKTDEAVDKKGAAVTEANKAAEDRRIEDAIRERTIKPEIQRTTRNLEEARSRTKAARDNYEKARTHPNQPGNDADIRALHERNCADLRELYPGEAIPFCDR